MIRTSHALLLTALGLGCAGGDGVLGAEAEETAPSPPGKPTPGDPPGTKPPPRAPDPAEESDCQGIGDQGACDGDTAYWCANGELRSLNCGQTGERCGWIGAEGRFYCGGDPAGGGPPAPEAANCDGVDYLGSCDGDDALYCHEGELHRIDCARWEQSCGWVDEETGYYCGGVLYLEEFPELDRVVVDHLRCSTAGGPLIVASARLCPCGSGRLLGGGQRLHYTCLCRDEQIAKFRLRHDGLFRFDLDVFLKEATDG